MLLLVGLTLQRLWAVDPNPLVELSGSAMGTTWSVKVFAPDNPEVDESRVQLLEAIRGRLERVEQLMSSYDSESEISRFNRFASTQPFALSPTTLDVFALALVVSALTDGAFDVTVGPLVAAWGFGAAAGLGRAHV